MRTSPSITKIILFLFVFSLLFGSFIGALFNGSSIQASAAVVESAQAPTGYRLIQYPLPAGSSAPWAIATDNLGREWIVEQVSNQLAMFNPSSSSFKEYRIPTPNSTANSVAVDQNGNVWFTELTGDKLGELKSGASSITEYRIPNGTYSLAGESQVLSCGPIGVIVGPTQSIWTLCLFSNQIDEFFPNNDTFVEFNLPVFQSGPAGLVFDANGNFWFTAADVNMIGHGIVSELRNNTSNGIEETAPQNATYSYSLQHETDFLGDNETIKSSLPSPSGIAMGPNGHTLWISEHVDSSFDSYNTITKSINRFWLSQTHGEFGYTVSFPNGLAVDSSGNVWIAEHYGNKVAEYNPATGKLTEWSVPCCMASSAGVYTLTLGHNGTVWFVEILGNAIGELEPIAGSGQGLNITLEKSQVSITGALPATVTVPVNIEYNNITNTQGYNTTLDISGITGTGALEGASAKFAPSIMQLSGSGTASSNLTLSVQSLQSGIYYLTVSARVDQGSVIYSVVLKIVVADSSQYTQLFVYAAGIGIVASIFVVGVLMIRRRGSAPLARRRGRTKFKRASHAMHGHQVLSRFL